MASNNEDYDFFDDGQYNGSRRARREQQYSGGVALVGVRSS